ncbi:hypothetical protein SAMN02910432_01962 [Ligilactobacillus ruminis DSM 20403 = NBRC 102161]|uniref:Uncharacterized protein n=1 Tax=Ligilactobacillus ruminis DSM 20403 = NBRC 102161 TaxID=1423798 RepID=A0A1I2T8X8_9LACO|nr:hypothetical protein SAMN02910432_01962 [Ligilactobacillus ruminis DSM 20403 = NBRC 102161]
MPYLMSAHHLLGKLCSSFQIVCVWSTLVKALEFIRAVEFLRIHRNTDFVSFCLHLLICGIQHGSRSKVHDLTYQILIEGTDKSTNLWIYRKGVVGISQHIAIVFTRYFMIALEQRKDEDYRTLGEIFFFMSDELADITFSESLQIILETMIESLYAVFQVTGDQIQMFISLFVDCLPIFLQHVLTKTTLAIG